MAHIDQSAAHKTLTECHILIKLSHKSFDGMSHIDQSATHKALTERHILIIVPYIIVVAECLILIKVTYINVLAGG